MNLNDTAALVTGAASGLGHAAAAALASAGARVVGLDLQRTGVISVQKSIGDEKATRVGLLENIGTLPGAATAPAWQEFLASGSSIAPCLWLNRHSLA